MASSMLRVIDTRTNYQISITQVEYASAPEGRYTVLTGVPAVDARGFPLPPVYGTSTSGTQVVDYLQQRIDAALAKLPASTGGGVDAATVDSKISTAVAPLNTAIAAKADASALDAKADVSALAAKADVSALAAKADTTTVNTALAGKASPSDIDAKLDTALSQTVISDNLYNLSNKTASALLSGVSPGATVANASYSTTEYMPCKAGDVVTAPAREIGWYKGTGVTAGEFISLDNTNTSSAVKSFTAPAGATYFRISFYLPAAPDSTSMITVNKAYPTSYVPFGSTKVSVYAKTADLAPLSAAIAGKQPAGNYASVAATANLYDPTVAKVGYLLASASPGALTANASYITSAFIPCIAGDQFTGPFRQIGWYKGTDETAGNFISVDGTNTNSDVKTFTAPAGATWFRVAFYQSVFASAMIVKGATYPTSYVSGVPVLANAQLPAKRQIGWSKTGSAMQLTFMVGGWPLALNLVVPDSTRNRVFNIADTNYGGGVVHGANPGDDVAPYKQWINAAGPGYVGANHSADGFAATFTNPDAKTAADLGSVYTDGTRQYVVIAVDASKVTLIGSYTRDATTQAATTAAVAPTANLTYVSGGTGAKTGALDYTTKAVANLSPYLQPESLQVLADGVPIAADGSGTADCIKVREVYTILDFAALYDTLKANAGVAYTALNIPAGVRVASTYTFLPSSRCDVTVEMQEVTPTRLDTVGGIQSVMMARTGYSTTRYVPGASDINGHTYATGQVMDAITYTGTGDQIATTNLPTAGQPPIFVLDKLSLSGTTTVGFAIGYYPWQGAASDSDKRIANAPTNLLKLESTKKIYPQVTTNQAPGWGRLVMKGFRVYLSPAQTDSIVTDITSTAKDPVAAWYVLSATAGLDK